MAVSRLPVLLVACLLLGAPHEGVCGAKVCLQETKWLVDGLMRARPPGEGGKKLGATAFIVFGPGWDSDPVLLRNQFCVTIAESAEKGLPFCGTIVQEKCRRVRTFVDEESLARGIAEWLSIDAGTAIEVKGSTFRMKLRRKGGEPFAKILFKAGFRSCDPSGCASGHVWFEASGGFLEAAP